MRWRGWLTGRPLLRGTLRLVLITVTLWLVLTAGKAPWPAGLIVVTAAVVTGLLLGPPRLYPWRPWQLVRFVLYFLRGSLVGGFDVSLRALSPSQRLSPCLLRHPTRVPAGQPRILLVSAISLMPGTLTAEVHDDELVVHLLSPGMQREVKALEDRVLQLFRFTDAEGSTTA